jgi:hypothetical protein
MASNGPCCGLPSRTNSSVLGASAGPVVTADHHAQMRPRRGSAGNDSVVAESCTETANLQPSWPAGPGDQQMMLHPDIEVTIWTHSTGTIKSRSNRCPPVGSSVTIATPSIPGRGRR